MSFRFRNKLPPMALSTVVVVSGGLYFSKCCVKYEFDLIINGKHLKNFFHVRWSKMNAFGRNLDHIILLNLRFKANLDMIGELNIKNGWNHAEISLAKNDVKWKRLHVQEQKTNMEDIQIINPDDAKEGKEKRHVCKLN